MVPHLTGFNLQEWIDENRDDWGVKRMVWENSDFWVFVVRGPNSRVVFHDNPGDEIFFQVEGKLQLHYLDPNGDQTVAVLGPGEMFLLSAHVPHSPRRDDGSWSLVIGRKRGSEEPERWMWYCEQCNATLHKVSMVGRGFGEDAKVAAEGARRLRADKNLRTCRQCGHESTI